MSLNLPINRQIPINQTSDYLAKLVERSLIISAEVKSKQALDSTASNLAQPSTLKKEKPTPAIASIGRFSPDIPDQEYVCVLINKKTGEPATVSSRLLFPHEESRQLIIVAKSESSFKEFARRNPYQMDFQKLFELRHRFKPERMATSKLIVWLENNSDRYKQILSLDRSVSAESKPPFWGGVSSFLVKICRVISNAAKKFWSLINFKISKF